MWPNPQYFANLVTFTEEILNGQLHFCATHKENRRLKIEVATKMDDCFAMCQYKIYEPKNNEISTAISKSKIANL